MLRVLYSPLFSARAVERESCTSILLPPFPGPRFKALWWGKSRWQMQRDSKLLTHSSSIMLWSAKEFKPNLNHESFVKGKLQFTRRVECNRYIFKERIFLNLGTWDKAKNFENSKCFWPLQCLWVWLYCCYQYTVTIPTTCTSSNLPDRL